MDPMRSGKKIGLNLYSGYLYQLLQRGLGKAAHARLTQKCMQRGINYTWSVHGYGCCIFRLWSVQEFLPLYGRRKPYKFTAHCKYYILIICFMQVCGNLHNIVKARHCPGY